jgi:pimeloyl-ACP methyl ester carboxylesterase
VTGTQRSYGVGRYHTGEGDLVITPLGYSGGGPLVVVCPGLTGTAAGYSPPAVRRDLDVLAAAGCVVIATDLGGGNTWGLDTVVHPTTGRIAEVRAYAAAAWDADITRMALLGDSMGAMNALGYTWRAPANVKAAGLRLPVVAADALHDRDPSGIGAFIDAAYGSGSNWEADKANRDPSATANAAAIAAIAGRVRIWHSTNDPVVVPADITAYTAATGVRAVPLGEVAHDPALAYPAIHAQAQAQWILQRLNT